MLNTTFRNTRLILSKNKFFYLVALIILVCCNFSAAQNIEVTDELYNVFTKYTDAPREVAYAHLNKSVFIDGETLGFTVYIFDKELKTFSTRTRNVYCTITDKNGNEIKSKMLLAVNGICDGSFFIDNLLSEGNYTFKAYTNYMKNFEEMNYYIQNFRVLTSDKNVEVPEDAKIDVQFLAEGGHLVRNVQSTIGVVIKDGEGLGIGNINATILDENSQIIGKFRTDQFGLGRFAFRPRANTNYVARFVYNDSLKEIELPKPDPNGIVMNMVDVNSRIAIQIKTNAETIGMITNETYNLMIHNGKSLKSIPINFEEHLQLDKLINKGDLFNGINIFTLFNPDNKPVSERIYFNYQGISPIASQRTEAFRETDSISIKLKMPEIEESILQNFSISVLPDRTESYLHSHNIMSYSFLQPYIKGYLENAAYYFTNIDLKKQRQLDNLLITQGWSSYDWNNLFNNTPEYNYNFEEGVTIKANINDGGFSSYSVYSSKTNFAIVDVVEGQKSFIIPNNYPFETDDIYVYGLTKQGKTRQPKLFLQYYPSSIPEFKNYVKILPRRKPNVTKDISFQNILQTSWTGFQQLDEVVLNVKKRQSKIEKVTRNEMGTVDVFDETTSYAYRNIASYLRAKGFQVYNNQGEFQVSAPGRSIGRKVAPVFLLNGLRLTDPTILNQINMNIIDYVVIDKNGISFAGNATGGLIKIFTDPTKNINDNSTRKTSLKLNYPLTFTASKKFYAPKYSFYQSSFFNSYGVIDWLPKAKVNDEGFIEFKFKDLGYKSIVLKIEGSANGKFISESIEVEIPEKS